MPKSYDEQFIESLKNFFIKKLIKVTNVSEVKLLGSLSRGTYVGKPKQFDFFLFYESLQGFELQKFKTEVLDCLVKEEPLERFEIVDCISKNRGFPYLNLKAKVELKNISRVIKIDLVPCLKGTANSHPVDKTILHDRYLSKLLTQEEKSEIKKLKRLLKKTGLYGADSTIKGFSGYCCQILICNYKKIDLIPLDLFVLPDPVCKSRNLLASVSSRNLFKFKFLLKNKGKLIDKDQSPELYIMENAPLKYVSSFNKEEFVVSAIYYKGDIILELKPYLLKKLDPEKIGYDNLAFSRGPNQDFYFSSKGILKKYKLESFLERYPNLKPIPKEEINKNYYNYFKFFK